MAGINQQRWVSFAETDEDVWKCLLIARALKRSFSTRPLVVITSDNVSKKTGRKLQDEVGQVYWVGPEEHPGMSFRSISKLKAQQLPGLGKTVFLDNNVLPLKNCDDFFHRHGVQWVGQGESRFAAVMVKPRSLGEAEQKRVTETVVGKENVGKPVAKKGVDVTLEEIRYCEEIDMKSEHPTPLVSQDVKMICFVDGHPHLTMDSLEKRGLLEKEIQKICLSLCPELHPPKLVNGYGVEEDLPWELTDSIAIVGMACRYPCANNLDEFWSLLEQGLEGIRKVPEGRWTKDKAFIRMDGMRGTEAGFLSCPVDTFDAKFFNTNAADMHYLDPQQRLSLRVVWEALEHAGVDPNSLKNSLTGVFGGWWRNDYKEMLQMIGVVDSDFLRGYMGNSLGPLTARISHFFELIGPSFSTESGCSTSIAGVDMACDSLRNDACNLAIAVGANLLLHPFSPSLIETVLAPDGRCKTYDASADGFGRAEGIGVLILKRFSNAVADGDRIWGVLRGSAVVQEGPSKSMGTPTVDVEAKAMELALERAAVDPNDVDFLETHGTGTPVGDPIEIAAVAKAYSKKGRKEPLTIGSVKTNIGHTESVCGIASIQKTVLSMKNELIPKHLHLKELNPEINLDSIPAKLPLNPIPWKRRKGGKPRIAGVNSFGITGAQAHVLVQEPPEVLPPHRFPFTDKRELRMLTFSAKTEESFKAQVAAYTELLKEEKFSLKDIEYTMHTGRPHMALRQVAFGQTNEELITAMEGMKAKQVPNMPPQLCFLFTGQGSQYSGMAKTLYDESIVFKSNFDWCDSVLQKEHGFSLREALWNPKEADTLKASLYSQTSIFVIEFCLLRLWESWGVKPDAVLGHSLGEFAAAVAAEMLSPEDALNLVVTRSKLINALPNASMLVVAADLDHVQDYMERAFANEKKWLDVAAVNSPSQTVLAGPTSIIKDFKAYCDNNEVKTTILDASHAFHSRLMDPMLEEYEAAAKKIQYQESKPGCLFISGVEGKVISRVDAKYWIKHTREKVKFIDASHSAVREGQSLFLEVGPHPVLSTLMVNNVDEIADIVTTASLRRKTEDWETILSALAKLYSLGRPIAWNNFHRFTGGHIVDLPGYHFEETPYWMSIKDEGTTPFHPLVGSFVPNPSDSTIFKSSVNVHRLPFLKDHALGDKIIFPCAGYLDMCLTAGYAATQCSEGTYVKPTNALSLKSFAIATPVCLNELTPTEFQVVVSKSPEGETISTVYTRLFLEDGSYKWVRNASATFTPNAPSIVTPEFPEIQARVSEVLKDRFDYEWLREFGFHFGPSLQVLTRGWRHLPSTGDEVKEYLFQFETKESQEDLDRFIIHPWSVDPMLQTQILSLGLVAKEATRKRLVVPVQVDSFTWWGNSAGKGFVYIKNTPTGNEAHLFSEEGKLMVSMLGTEFMETTISNILSLIDSQKNPYPSLAEMSWKERLGPRERRVPEALLESISLQDFLKDSSSYNEFTPEEEKFYKDFQKLAGLYILKTVKELGVESESAICLPWNEMAELLKVLPQLNKFLRYLLNEVAKEGYLTTNDGETFKILKNLPKLQEIVQAKDALLQEMLARGVGTVDLSWVESLWGVLSQVLTGKVDALPILYPEDSSAGPAQLYYAESIFAKKRFALNKLEGTVLSRLAHFGTKSVVRVLEVGAGLGSATQHLIKNMTEAGPSHFEYTYTDVSPAFLQKGEAHFEESGVSAKFAVLNVESDPLSQGFIPGHYDVIIASWVLHATRDVEESLLNLRKLLRPGGYLLLTELVIPSRDVNLSFGGLEGFWRFTDSQLRPWNCELSVEGWKAVLRQAGFKDFAGVPSYAGNNALILAKLGKEASIFYSSQPALPKANKDGRLKTWIVFADEGKNAFSKEFQYKLQQTNNKVVTCLRSEIIAKITSSEEMEKTIGSFLSSILTDPNLQVEGILYLWGLSDTQYPMTTVQSICEPFMCLCKHLAKYQGPPIKVLSLTRGNMSTSSSDYFQNLPTASPLIGMLNVLSNENPDLLCRAVDLDGNPSYPASEAVAEVFSELFSLDNEAMIAYRQGQRVSPRLKPYKVKSAPLPIPKTPRYKLILPSSHLIQDLQFAPAEPEPIGEGEVEVEVRSYALNFLDVMMVTKPDPVFEKYNYLGIDISGVVTAVGPKCEKRVGDRVVVVRRKGEAMPSHLVVKDKRTLVIPDDITFAEAATYPMCVITTAACLVDTAKAKPGDVLLIHTASGGVGLMAIQIARRIGCEIIVTAGNERKRNFLRNLGLKHVFNSRTTDYEKDIRAALGGRGVDIVMNSLTGPGFKEATLNVCEPNARFIEMSKMNIWSKDDVKRIRPDVFYEVVDVSSLDEDAIQRLTDYLNDQLIKKVEDRPKPLPFTHFEAAEIREALEYMEKVKHVGKIVLSMPEQVKGEPVSLLFNNISTYLIAGGCGGIGLEVGKWMVSQGAKTLLLLGRRPPTDEALEKIENLRTSGVRVEVRQCDVSKKEDLYSLMEEFSNGTLPPLRGIMHAAGLLEDALFENQEWAKYERVLAPKATGAWNLHELSLNLPYPLEHFVLFSSMTVTLGAVAQSNYVAANQYLDSLVHYRNSIGLTGTTINWGQWGQVGMAATLHVHLHKPFTVNQGLAALQHVIKAHKVQVAAHEADLAAIKQVLPSTKGLLTDIEEITSQSVEIDGDEFWREYDAASAEQRHEVVRKFLKRLIRITLKMDKNEEIEDNVSFQDMGMDSLMMVEMKNGLQGTVGKRIKISINAVKDCKTVAQLADRLVQLITGKEAAPALSLDQVRDLVRRDAELDPDLRVTAEQRKNLVSLKKAGVVLVIGSTGMVGPYVVREIFKRPGIRKVICLIQPNPLQIPSERFKKVFEKKGLLPSIDLARVETIAGSVNDRKFGLSSELYHKLASEVEVVFNLAVKVAFDETYRQTEDPKSSRSVNVFGMKNILDFAATGKLKHVYHASTFAAVTQLDETGRLKETWPQEEEIKYFPNSAYSISKLVCDRLAEQAVERGIPVKVFRLPQVGGDSLTGGNVQLDSFLMMRFLVYLHTGYMHNSRIPLSLMSVDQCAKLSVDLFYHEGSDYGIFNVLNPHLGDEREFESLAKEFGVDMTVLESQKFADKWKQMESNDDIISLVKYALEKDADMFHLRDQAMPYYTAWLEGNKDIFRSKKLETLLPKDYPSSITPSWQVLRNDLKYARDSGVFEKFRIKSKNTSS